MDSISSITNNELKAELLTRDEELRKQLRIISSQKKIIAIGGVSFSITLLLFVLCR